MIISGIYCDNIVNDDNSGNLIHPLRDKKNPVSLEKCFSYFHPGVVMSITDYTCYVMTISYWKPEGVLVQKLHICI